MKFHCDRCKTRYSIADERVRGKILKIRCKNCSAVITVKEGGQVAAPPTPAGAQPKPGAPAGARPKPAIPSAASRPSGAAKPLAGAAKPAAAGPQTSQAMRMGTNAPTPAARPGSIAQGRATLASRSTSIGAQEVARAGANAKPNSALQGAFAQALRKQPEPGPADSVSNAPATLDAEWYVSEDGEQYGPYELRQAQDWVSSRRMDDELYCWSEGFDDWLPVEKVSHFRGLRSRAPAASAPGFAHAQPGSTFDLGDDGQTVVDAAPDERNYQPREETPIPLFAATMAQIAAEAPTAIEEDNPFAGALKAKSRGSNGASARGGGAPATRKPEPAPRPALPLPKSGAPKPATPQRPAPQAAIPTPVPATDRHDRHDGNNDFEIGEASRVVKLPPMMGRNAGNAAPVSRSGLPGVDSGGLGRGTGTFQQYTNSGLPIIQGGGTIDMPRPEILQPSRRAKSLAVPIAVAGAVLVGVIGILLYLALAGGDDDEDHGLARVRVAGDGLAYNFVDEDKDGKDDTTGQTVEEVKAAASKSGGTARRVIRRNPREGSGSVGTAGGGDEVDLGGGGGDLDPDDLIEVYRNNKIGVSLCYTSALKKDPLLKVAKAVVTIRVGTTGAVSMVSIPSLSGSDLGNCLQKRIKAWRFPKNSSGLDTQFPIIFDN
jgi:predicted Zn finger-like uncharacterized protein